MTATLTPADITALLRRRRRYFLAPFLLIFGASVAAGLLLPSVYEATATIRIDRQQIPRQVLETAPLAGTVDEYLEALSQRVLSNDNLLQVAERLNLFPAPTDEAEKQAIGKEMRSAISRNTLYVEVGPPTQRRGESVAMAFTISYRAQDGETARDVTNALANLYLSVNERWRTDQAAQLADFLKAESARLEARVAELEQKLAEFKQEHAASLPDYNDLNLARLHTLQDQIDRIGERIVALTQQRIALNAELARHEPQSGIVGADRRVLTPAQQVERLRLDYLNLSASYSPLHPDLVRLQNQLQALTGATPQAARVLGLIGTLEEKRAELIDAQQRYSDEHPDVRRLASTVQKLKDQLAALGESGGASANPSNPAYVTVRTQLQAVESELRAETALQEQLRQRQAEYESRLIAAPAVERDYRALVREYETAMREYRETRDRLLRAESAENAERGHIGDRFSLVSQAVLPEGPVSPNRIGIILLGFILASGLGVTVAAAAEYLDQSVSSARSVTAIVGEPPLATIPEIANGERKRWFGFARGHAGYAAGVAVATLLVTLGIGFAQSGGW